jgi:hypothetical protein
MLACSTSTSRSRPWCGCDDHLARSRRVAIRPRLDERGVRNLLIAPDTSVRLTPQHLVKVEAMLGV